MRTFCGITTDGMLDYLAAIYTLGEDRAVPRVTTTILAEKMHVSPAAASSMLKRLEESGFVVRSDTEGVILSDQGRIAALQLLRRHRLLEVFLMQVMKFTWDQVDVEAHRLEHAISAEFVERMDQLCGYPTHCPHGDPIPDSNGNIPTEPLISVLDMQPGQQGVLWRIGTDDPRVLRYLSQLQLTPGQGVRLIEKAPFNGPITIELDNVALENGHVQTNGWPDAASPSMDSAPNTNECVSHVLGNELAEQLFVLTHRAHHDPENPVKAP